MQKYKTVLITGASEGIGRSVAEIFAENGHDLVLVVRNVSNLEELALELKTKYAVNAHVFAADLIPVGAAQALFEDIPSKQINIDILVNNAGMMQVGKF
jgi:short-subunit dehydrogenase